MYMYTYPDVSNIIHEQSNYSRVIKCERSVNGSSHINQITSWPIHSTNCLVTLLTPDLVTSCHVISLIPTYNTNQLQGLYNLQRANSGANAYTLTAEYHLSRVVHAYWKDWRDFEVLLHCLYCIKAGSQYNASVAYHHLPSLMVE